MRCSLKVEEQPYFLLLVQSFSFLKHAWASAYDFAIGFQKHIRWDTAALFELDDTAFGFHVIWKDC